VKLNVQSFYLQLEKEILLGNPKALRLTRAMLDMNERIRATDHAIQHDLQVTTSVDKGEVCKENEVSFSLSSFILP
jgi:hypothetical protein